MKRLNKDSKIIVLIAFFVIYLSNLAHSQTTYVIEKGETLFGIAKKLDVSVEVLKKINQIEDVTKIKEGTELIVPLTHIIAKGETLYGICRQYGITMEQLLLYNDIKDPEKILVGHKIYLPRIISEEGSSVAFWPHPGDRERVFGKVSGMLINGTPGDPVVSVSEGEVKWVGEYQGFQGVILIKSIFGYIFFYGGNETIFVNRGDWVEKGTPIGELGISPFEGKAQVLFAVFKDEIPVDPYTVVTK